jgi:hypothetical protein
MMAPALPPSSSATFFFPAAGKTDQLDAVVGNQQAGILVRERNHVQAAIGPANLLDALRKQ